MNLKKIFVYLIIFIFTYNFAFSSDFKIVAKINNEILTNYDIEIEKKYLIILNPNLKSLSQKELEKLSKNSLIRQSIKKEEIEKHLDFQANSNLGDALIKEIMINQGFKNKLEYSKYLNKKGLSLIVFKEKLLIDRLWNSIIFEKFKNKIKIDEEKIEENVRNFIKNKKKVFEYNLSEILFDETTDYQELKKFIKEHGFVSAANKYSISDTSSSGGKIGWIKLSSLNKKLKFSVSKLKKEQISDPIQIPNGKLLIKVNEIKEVKNQINIKQEIEKQINFEKNRQLKNHSLNYYKKLKQNKIINEY